MDKTSDKDKQTARTSGSPSDSPAAGSSDVDELYRRLHPEMRRPKPSPDAVAAAMEAAQRLAAEADLEDAVENMARDLAADSSQGVCRVCGHRNRPGNNFCAMCGAAAEASTESAQEVARRSRGDAIQESPFLHPEPDLKAHPVPEPERRPVPTRSTGLETHHYHHHYHYFPGTHEGMVPRGPAEPAREERLRPNAALRGDMSRAEAAVRRITHEWVLACNTKHLDDLLDLYVADGLVLRSNYAPIRGAAAVREFFFAALDAGLGEVEMEPLRVEVMGDMAYEAGRFKALVPSAIGKRREERGKYLWVCARQRNGEWKLAVDCWSSDLTLTTAESDVPPSAGVKSNQPRKG